MSEALLPPSPDDVTVNKHLPPHSVEAEQAVLGGLMLDNQRLDAVREVLGEEDFYRDDHRQIFRMMCELGEASEPLDVITQQRVAGLFCLDISDRLIIIAARCQLHDLESLGN